MNFRTRYDLETIGDFKREAKAQLNGRWREAILISLIPVVLSIFNSAAFSTSSTGFNNQTGWSVQVDYTGLFDILIQIIVAFINTGIAFTFLDLLRDRTYVIRPIEDSIQVFRREYFRDIFLIKMYVYIFTFLWTLLLIIPGIVKGYAYSQAEFIYKDTLERTGERLAPRECLRESERLMRGNKGQMFGLSISFLGWIILTPFTLGLLLLWLAPYMEMTFVVFYEKIAGEYYGEDFYYEDEEDYHQEDFRRESKDTYASNRPNTYDRNPGNQKEEIGKDPDDFSDFEDF